MRGSKTAAAKPGFTQLRRSQCANHERRILAEVWSEVRLHRGAMC